VVEQWLLLSPLFASLSEAERRNLAERLVWRRYDKGVYLFHEGEPGEWAYFVVEGQVRVFRVTAEGREFVLGQWGPGHAVGLVAVAAGDPYPASARAVAPTQVLAVARADLGGLTSRLPGLAVSVAREVSGRARLFAERLMQDATLDARGKLAALLLTLADEGTRVEGGVLVATHLSHQDLGLMCGTTRETVSRTLSAWQKAGLVELKRRGVVLRDQAELARLAGQV
jgi:CRP/FNR family cyclic AMP-dependent transcriptional regulator